MADSKTANADSARTLWRWTRGWRGLYVSALIAMAAGILLLYLSPLIIRAAIDGLIDHKPVGQFQSIVDFILKLAGNRIAAALALAGMLVLVVTLVSGVFTFLRGRWSALAAEGIARNLRDRLFAHLQHVPVSYHDSAQTGDLVQRCTSDVDTIRAFYSTQVIEIGRATMLFLTATPVLIYLDWKMGLVAIAVMPVIVTFSAGFFKRVQKAFKLSDEAEGKLTTTLQENLTGIRVVRAFARQAFEVDRFDEKNANHQKLSFKLFVLMALYWSLSDVLIFVQMAAVLFVGAWRVSRGTMTVGTLVAFLQYEGMVIWPIRQLGRILTETGKAVVSLGRVQEILDQPVETSPDATISDVRGAIELRDVSFSHSGKPVLWDISLSIPAGQTLAILGPSGAGKSTLVNLLLRFYDPDSGSITLDGQPIAQLSRKSVRSQYAVVMQEPFLFSRTLRQNILLGEPTASEDDTLQAAMAAAIHESIESFDKKYDTLIGERGVTLSGGQRQRVAIARALLRDAPVLVFDDALSAVDTRTEADILDALRQRRNRRTTILIAHRISTLAQADRIVVLEQGRITQDGTHEQLINEPGLYRRLWEIQGALEEDLKSELVSVGQDNG